MRTDYVAQALDIKYRTERERDELTQVGLANVSLLAQTATPTANVGILADGADEWEVGHEYKRGDLFKYEGSLGFVKQDHTSKDNRKPFTIGTESLYGARPKPVNGVYPYVYNMAVELGMRVSEGAAELGMRVSEGENVYVCYANPTETLLSPPSQVSEIFKKESE